MTLTLGQGWGPCRQSGCGDRGRHPDPGHPIISSLNKAPCLTLQPGPAHHCSFPPLIVAPPTAVLQCCRGVIPSVNKDPCSTCYVAAQCGTHPNILHFHRREEGKLLFIFKNECLLSSVLHFHKMYIYLYKCVPSG